WPVAPPTNMVDVIPGAKLVEMMTAFAAREPIVYLHPSSGLYFEPFTGELHGTISRLVLRSPGDSQEPQLSAAVVSSNEELWQQRWTNHLQHLAARVKAQAHGAPDNNSRSLFTRLVNRLRLIPARDPAAPGLGVFYSKSLNCWGVELQ